MSATTKCLNRSLLTLVINICAILLYGKQCRINNSEFESGTLYKKNSENHYAFASCCLVSDKNCMKFTDDSTCPKRIRLVFEMSSTFSRRVRCDVLMRHWQFTVVSNGGVTRDSDTDRREFVRCSRSVKHIRYIHNVSLSLTNKALIKLTN